MYMGEIEVHVNAAPCNLRKPIVDKTPVAIYLSLIVVTGSLSSNIVFNFIFFHAVYSISSVMTYEYYIHDLFYYTVS